MFYDSNDHKRCLRQSSVSTQKHIHMYKSGLDGFGSEMYCKMKFVRPLI